MVESYIIVEICTNNQQGTLIGKLKNTELESFLEDSGRDFISIDHNHRNIWVYKQDIESIIIYKQVDAIQIGVGASTI